MASGNHPFATGPREALNAALMQGTAEIHRAAERRPFMVAQFKGELPKEAYAAYIGRLFYVYVALEEAAERLSGDERVGAFHMPTLFRAEKLAKDLAALVGPDWRSTISTTPAARAYADRIREVAREFPPGYIAHHWLRYMGYVLGQNLIRDLLRKTYGEDVPVEFYSYPEIAEPKEFLRSYHGAMNGVELSEEEVARVVEEGSRAFQLQIDLTDELARDFGVGDVSAEETEKLMDELNAKHG